MRSTIRRHNARRRAAARLQAAATTTATGLSGLPRYDNELTASATRAQMR